MKAFKMARVKNIEKTLQLRPSESGLLNMAKTKPDKTRAPKPPVSSPLGF